MYIAESYEGISRIKYPDWEGWEEIDRHKKMYGFPENLKFSDKLDEAVKNFSPKTPEEIERNRQYL